MKPTPAQVRAADSEGSSAAPGAANPYRGQPVLAAVWMDAYVDASRRRLGIAPGADAPTLPADWR